MKPLTEAITRSRTMKQMHEIASPDGNIVANAT